MTAQPQEQFEEEQEELEETEGEALPETNEAEEKARAMGWRPKEEYKGPADKWVDAEAFLEKAENDLPQVRKVNHHLLNKVEKLERGVQEILAHQDRQLSAARQEAYDRALNDLKKQHQQAVEDGDHAKADRAFNQAQNLAKQQVTESEQPKPKFEGPDHTVRETVEAWKAKNPWYSQHPDMYDLANKKEAQLAAQGVGLEERLEQTAAYIKERYPQVFRTRDQAPSQLRNRPNGVIKAKPKAGTYDALKPEYRTACDRFVAARNNAAGAQAEWLQFASPEMFQ